MAEQPRNKGQFMQAGAIHLYPVVGGNVVSHDGTLGLDELVSQADYPVLFQTIGVEYNDPDKGDDNVTQMRTPPSDGLPTVTGFEWRIRF